MDFVNRFINRFRRTQSFFETYDGGIIPEHIYQDLVTYIREGCALIPDDTQMEIKDFPKSSTEVCTIVYSKDEIQKEALRDLDRVLSRKCNVSAASILFLHFITQSIEGKITPQDGEDHNQLAQVAETAIYKMALQVFQLFIKKVLVPRLYEAYEGHERAIKAYCVTGSDRSRFVICKEVARIRRHFIWMAQQESYRHFCPDLVTKVEKTAAFMRESLESVNEELANLEQGEEIPRNLEVVERYCQLSRTKLNILEIQGDNDAEIYELKASLERLSQKLRQIEKVEKFWRDKTLKNAYAKYVEIRSLTQEILLGMQQQQEQDHTHKQEIIQLPFRMQEAIAKGITSGNFSRMYVLDEAKEILKLDIKRFAGDEEVVAALQHAGEIFSKFFAQEKRPPYVLTILSCTLFPLLPLSGAGGLIYTIAIDMAYDLVSTCAISSFAGLLAIGITGLIITGAINCVCQTRRANTINGILEKFRCVKCEGTLEDKVKVQEQEREASLIKSPYDAMLESDDASLSDIPEVFGFDKVVAQDIQ
jgi:CRISPR/Cas system-associated exonuclease Cas4 (RecB family)